MPVKVGGDLRLAPAAKGTTVVEITGEVSCSVPLLGGKLAAFVGSDVQRTLTAEEQFQEGHLAAGVTRKPRSPRR